MSDCQPLHRAGIVKPSNRRAVGLRMLLRRNVNGSFCVLFSGSTYLDALKDVRTPNDAHIELVRQGQVCGRWIIPIEIAAEIFIALYRAQSFRALEEPAADGVTILDQMGRLTTEYARRRGRCRVQDAARVSNQQTG